MIKSIDEMERPSKRQIDLTGPDGNAFNLMGVAKYYANEMNLDSNAIIEDMKSSDYEHLLEVFDKHFGIIVDLFR